MNWVTDEQIDPPPTGPVAQIWVQVGDNVKELYTLKPGGHIRMWFEEGRLHVETTLELK